MIKINLCLLLGFVSLVACEREQRNLLEAIFNPPLLNNVGVEETTEVDEEVKSQISEEEPQENAKKVFPGIPALQGIPLYSAANQNIKPLQNSKPHQGQQIVIHRPHHEHIYLHDPHDHHVTHHDYDHKPHKPEIYVVNPQHEHKPYNNYHHGHRPHHEPEHGHKPIFIPYIPNNHNPYHRPGYVPLDHYNHKPHGHQHEPHYGPYEFPHLHQQKQEYLENNHGIYTEDGYHNHYYEHIPVEPIDIHEYYKPVDHHEYHHKPQHAYPYEQYYHEDKPPHVEYNHHNSHEHHEKPHKPYETYEKPPQVHEQHPEHSHHEHGYNPHHQVHPVYVHQEHNPNKPSVYVYEIKPQEVDTLTELKPEVVHEKPNPPHHQYEHKPPHHEYEHKPTHHEHKPPHHEYVHKPPHHEYEHKPPHHEYEHKPSHHEHKPPHHEYVHKPPHHEYEHKPPHHEYEHKPSHHEHEHKPPHHEYVHKPPHHEYEHKPPHNEYAHKPPHHVTKPPIIIYKPQVEPIYIPTHYPTLETNGPHNQHASSVVWQLLANPLWLSHNRHLAKNETQIENNQHVDEKNDESRKTDNQTDESKTPVDEYQMIESDHLSSSTKKQPQNPIGLQFPPGPLLPTSASQFPHVWMPTNFQKYQQKIAKQQSEPQDQKEEDHFIDTEEAEPEAGTEKLDTAEDNTSQDKTGTAEDQIDVPVEDVDNRNSHHW